VGLTPTALGFVCAHTCCVCGCHLSCTGSLCTSQAEVVLVTSLLTPTLGQLLWSRWLLCEAPPEMNSRYEEHLGVDGLPEIQTLTP
jgi:hypothetical protein